jgi:hypothetical protein
MPFQWFGGKQKTTRLILLLNGHKRDHLRFQTLNEISTLPSAVRPVPHSEELPLPKRLENLAFSNDSSDSDEDYRQQEGGNVDCYLTFEASCSLSEPHLLMQGDHNEFFCD